MTEEIARACFDAVNGYEADIQKGCVFPAWGELGPEERQSYLSAVQFYLDNPGATPKEAHHQWRLQRSLAGWRFGNARQVSILGLEPEYGTVDLPDQKEAIRRARLNKEENRALDDAKAEADLRGAVFLAEREFADFMEKNAAANEGLLAEAQRTMDEKIREANKEYKEDLAFNAQVNGGASSLKDGDLIHIHPALAPWHSLRPDLKKKFEIFKDAFEKARKV